ncbi:hypothetical protein GCM10007416_22040 [Kroppenstedtia guangzhouensis]|uniref:Restriction endonuclease type IV Mrr domain-containing protein n=1 Tax=Kroppenstedtia guangzhouensis TaxID=1274356 RepID=A0ABQ1GQJ4_9BACL|nr:restriction endonuclease [Kroppenstedtia guangzhouensis]GGA48473.1 hypothetical protein GCM10007416_22040 [Kroppenstedtia guangzhouensis]
MTPSPHQVRTPLFPLYSEVGKMLKLYRGEKKEVVYGMIKSIDKHTGTPQNPVDWTDPDRWIGERLAGEEAGFARKVWAQGVNPRHVYGSYLLINGYQLAVPGADGCYEVTPRGEAFLRGEPEAVYALDEAEGLVELLSIIATKEKAQRKDLLPEWGAFLRRSSKFGTESTIKDTLRRRLANLVDRGLVQRSGFSYAITREGLRYAAVEQRAVEDPKKSVLDQVARFNRKQKQVLQQKLGSMHPYRFEQLVRDLLEAMGYEDVTVTKESGDKGVDVVANVQFGITTITEVVQVKRQQGNIGRPVLDQLRGALPYHKALRGTIITTGDFSAGCKEAALFPGAAPITLINGEKLMELLIGHEIGITKRSVELHQLDDEYFREPSEQEQAEEALEAEEMKP